MKSSQELNALVATVSATLDALKALSCQTESWDSLLIYQLGRLLVLTLVKLGRLNWDRPVFIQPLSNLRIF